LKEGKVEDAKHYLLEAGKTPGSPQLNSFGPDMSLAEELESFSLLDSDSESLRHSLGHGLIT